LLVYDFIFVEYRLLIDPAEIQGKLIIEYPTLQSFTEGNGQLLGDFEDFERIEANQTTFTALSKPRGVWTWGDGRYESCLGREVLEER